MVFSVTSTHLQLIIHAMNTHQTTRSPVNDLKRISCLLALNKYEVFTQEKHANRSIRNIQYHDRKKELRKRKYLDNEVNIPFLSLNLLWLFSLINPISDYFDHIKRNLLFLPLKLYKRGHVVVEYMNYTFKFCSK